MLDLNELKKETAISSEKFDFTILTPLFMHGWQEVGDNGRGGRPVSRAVNAELRGPSLRGILRYWWRSLQKEGYSTAALLQKEQAFFGGSSGGDKSGTRRSPLLLKISSLGNQALQETNKVANLCPHKKPGMPSLTLLPGRKLRIELQVLKKDSGEYDLYVNYCKFTFMLAGFGQRSRRGAGAVQLDNFNWTTVQEFRKELQEILQALHIEQEFNFQPQNTSCLLERRESKDPYPRLMRVWIGKMFKTAEDARFMLSEAGHVANPGNAPQMLGTARGGRQASPLLGTVRQIGTAYYPLVSEMSNPQTVNPRYTVQRDIFLRTVGVSI